MSRSDATTPARRRGDGAGVGLASAAVAGLGFGTVATLLNVGAGDALDDGVQRVASLVLNSGTAWAGAGVLGGWLACRTLRGKVGGPVALVVAVAAYYVAGAFAGSENADGSPDQILQFGLAALVVGPLLGLVGAAARRPDAAGLAAALVLPLAVPAERLWRSSGGIVPPDPARPAADVVLLVLAAAGAGRAVSRWHRGRGHG